MTLLTDATTSSPAPRAEVPTPARHRLWLPRRVLVTRSALQFEHGRRILERCEAAGVREIDVLRGDRLPPIAPGEDARQVYAAAKRTLAVTVAPPSARALQPIPPSADWRFDLAQGCPAHCQYCYLAGSLGGPPITRVFANLDEILAGLDDHVGSGHVTTGTTGRGHEGTTFEASCYTDPLGIEHLTGSLAHTVTHVGTHAWRGPVQLRFTTKFDDVQPLLGLPHHGRTRVRVSVNAAAVADRFEGGTSPVPDRFAALRALALGGYPVGLTIAPIMPVEDWRTGYADLLDEARTTLDGVPDLDLTVEMITHRFTAKSKDVLLGWYPRTRLEMDEDLRRAKRGRFATVKYVYPPSVMSDLRGWFEEALPARLPAARVLYWT